MDTIQMVGEILEPQIIEVGGGDVTVSLTMDTSFADKLLMSEEGAMLIQNKPVEYEGDTPVVNPSAMVPEVPYIFSVYGKRVWAVKEINGEIGLYYLAE